MEGKRDYVTRLRKFQPVEEGQVVSVRPTSLNVDGNSRHMTNPPPTYSVVYESPCTSRPPYLVNQPPGCPFNKTPKYPPGGPPHNRPITLGTDRQPTIRTGREEDRQGSTESVRLRSHKTPLCVHPITRRRIFQPLRPRVSRESKGTPSLVSGSPRSNLLVIVSI